MILESDNKQLIYIYTHIIKEIGYNVNSGRIREFIHTYIHIYITYITTTTTTTTTPWP